MPVGLKLVLEAVVREQLQLYDKVHHELIRDDPRFVAWTGTHLGHRGDKYLDRVVQRVREGQRHAARLKELIRQQGTTSIQEREAMPSPTVQAGALGNAGAISFEELLEDHCEQRRTLKLEQAACRGEDGRLEERALYLRLARELRAVDKSMADLSKQYQAALAQADVRAAMFARIREEFADEPERGARLQADLNAQVRRLTGIDGTGEASQ